MMLDSIEEIQNIMNGLYPDIDIISVDARNRSYSSNIAFNNIDKYDIKPQNIIEFYRESYLSRPPYNSNSNDLYDIFVPRHFPNKRIAITIKSWLLYNSGETLQKFRKKMIESGVIEAIISISDSLENDNYARSYSSSEKKSILVFSENNSSILLKHQNLATEESAQIKCNYSDLQGDEDCILYPTSVMAKKRLAGYKYALKDIATIKQGYNLSRGKIIHKDIVERVRGFSHDDYFNYKYLSNEANNYKYLVHMNNLDYTTVLHNIPPIISDDNPSLELSKLQPNDVLLTIRGFNLRSALVDYDENRNLYATNDICIIRPKKGVPGLYILAMLQSDLLSDYLLACNPRKTLRVSQLKDMPINCDNPEDTEWMRIHISDYATTRHNLVNAVTSLELSLDKMKEGIKKTINKELQERIAYAVVPIE